MSQDTCAVDGCEVKRVARGWCNRHWKSWRVNGDPLATDRRRAAKLEAGASGEYTCTKCGEVKPLSGFHKDARTPKGHHSSCKTCRGAQLSDYYADNRDERREAVQAYRDANRDIVRATDLRRYERHKEKRIAYTLEREHIRRALLKQNGWEPGVTRPALRKIHGDDCRYCGVTMTFTPFNGYEPERATIEHILPLSRGGSHTFDNTCLCCWQCNVRKNAKTLDEWEVITIAD